ncbi:MAG: recombinase RecX [Bacteroidetes bacterium SW_11_64_17]|nr:MAG: recombinase RecX [Bacteroidetes bacterium SW_11_64_17]
MPESSPEGTITHLDPQANNDDRVSVFLDGEFAFGVHEDLVVRHGLQVGARLTAEEIREIEADEEYVDAKQTALDYLAYKPRTEQEVRRKLRKQDVSRLVIDDVIARLYELEYLDDESYAHDYAHNRFSSKKYGPVRIRRELEERGVDRHLAEAAWEHAEKRWPRLADEDDPRRRRQKLYRYLRRRGFTSDTIRPILDELEREGGRDGTGS